MTVQFTHFQAAASADKLNEEFLVLENLGPNEFVAKGSSLNVGKAGQTRPRPLGVIDPGFVLRPGEKIRLVVGNPSKKSHGTPPPEEPSEETSKQPKGKAQQGIRNYFLFLSEPILVQTGLIVRIMLNQLEVARATYDAKAQNGLAKTPSDR